MGDLERYASCWRPKKAGRSNFLIPNGTFFFVLLIFLIVLGVIAKWVVPPIMQGVARARSHGRQDALRTIGAAAAVRPPPRPTT